MRQKAEIPIPLRGRALLNHSFWNKGTAFTYEERKHLGLLGLLPHHSSTLEEQVRRRYENFQAKKTPIERYEFLNALQERNETLFYRFAIEHVDVVLPYIYTPTVGQAALAYSLQYNQGRGLYLSYEHKSQMGQVISNLRQSEVDIIVVTDGERILGLGDLGVGGMAIPIGKSALYTLFGGIHPRHILPVLLDVGTNNPELLEDPNYIGLRKKRVEGEPYFAFVEQFIHLISEKYPNVLIQWEDFARPHALTLLQKYQKRICSFNDDIQGTAAVALAAILTALKKKKAHLKQERIAILGAGSAGVGIANILVEYMVAYEGLTETEARRAVYLIDRHGLILDDNPNVRDEQRPFARKAEWDEGWHGKGALPLETVVKDGKITILIGVSTKKGAFTQQIVQQLCTNTEQPLIFPLSNPNASAEATPQDLWKWSYGKAFMATGSPFGPIEAGENSYIISQCNNVYIFPSIGLCANALRLKTIPADLFVKAADTLSSISSSMAKEHPTELFPTLEALRDVSRQIAIELATYCMEKGYCEKVDSAEQAIDAVMWYPKYAKYIPE